MKFLDAKWILGALIAVSIATTSCTDDTEILPVEQPSTEQPSQEPPVQQPSEGGNSQNPVSGVTTLLKSFESSWGSWKSSRSYVYNAAGQIEQIEWAQETPGKQGGKYFYEYQGQQLVKVKEERAGYYKQYEWNGNKVVKMSSFVRDTARMVFEYEYDANGKIALQKSYQRLPDGTYQQFDETTYAYNMDGDLAESRRFFVALGSKSIAEIRSYTYPTELKPNPYPSFLELPGVIMQSHLPNGMSLKVDDRTINYTFTYQYRADGYPLKRFVGGPSGGETTTYLYY